MFKIPKEVTIKRLRDAYALRDNGTVFYQEFHGIEPVQGYLCLIVYYSDEVKGYLPPSELGLESPTERDLHHFLRRPVPVRVAGVVREDGVVVLSRRAAVEHLSQRLWEEIEPGQVVEGIVVTPAYPRRPMLVDLGGEVAEAPAGELTYLKWIPPKELQEQYPLYGEIKVKVISADPEKKKIYVSPRAVRPDPWEATVPERYRKGTIHSGTITGTDKDSGVFVRFFDGISCLCPAGWLLRNGHSPINKKVQVKIKKVDLKRRRINGKILRDR